MIKIQNHFSIYSRRSKKNNIKFNLVIVGEEFNTEMPEFTEARKLKKQIHILVIVNHLFSKQWLWKS